MPEIFSKPVHKNCLTMNGLFVQMNGFKIMAWVVKGKKEGVFTESKTVRKRTIIERKYHSFNKKSMSNSDWSRFTQRISVNAPIQKLYNALPRAMACNNGFTAV